MNPDFRWSTRARVCDLFSGVPFFPDLIKAGALQQLAALTFMGLAPKAPGAG
jgi:hypothetical protein